ncbi:MAG TPA: class II glutamine amidotransferase [Stellaceae bacterium]|jgi:glutamine amidotransferase
MCELLAMSSQQPATVNLALGILARHGGGDGPDKDGWGISYFEDGDVRLIKDAAPAYASPWIGFVEGLSLRSQLVFAHIRRATTGAVALRNTHPFMRELGGQPHVFAHNGSLSSIFTAPEFALGRFHPLGDTDSEWAFCALLERLAVARGSTGRPLTLERRIEIIGDFAAQLRREGMANFLYSDGEYAFLHGDHRLNDTPGLQFTVQRDADNGRPVAGQGGVTVEEIDHPVLLAASVPLTHEEWTPLRRGELLVVCDGEIQSRVVT